MLYRLLESDFQAYACAHEARFEPTSGPLRRVVVHSVDAYLACGRLQGGFARIRCAGCGAEHLLAFSCRTRNLCPSCQSKRSAVGAVWLEASVLLDVAHRHVVLTIPKKLRGLIERDRALHGLMARVGYAVLRRALAEAACEPEGVPGAVISLQTFGSYGANFHPHLHAIVTEGVFTKDGRYHPVIWPPEEVLEDAFRRRFLRALERAERLRPETRARLLSWRHSGFSVKATQRVASTERGRLARLARYATRVVVAVGAMGFREDGRVEIETPPDPVTSSTVLVLDRLELVHALCQQVPDQGMHLVRFYGAYSNRRRNALRRLRGEVEGAPAGDGALGPRPRAAPPAATPAPCGSEEASAVPGPPDRPPTAAEVARAVSWAKLLRKVFEVDPLRCPRCGGSMAVVAWITEAATIDRILAHRRRRGIESPFEGAQARAPPAA